MSDSKLPQVRIPLSKVLTPRKSTVSPDIDNSINKANQRLLNESFSEINAKDKTHMPFYDTESLAQAFGTDLRAFREVVAEADRDDIRQQNGQTFISQSLASEITDERYEQPRDPKQQAKLEAISTLIADVAAIPYKNFIAIINQQTFTKDNE